MNNIIHKFLSSRMSLFICFRVSKVSDLLYPDVLTFSLFLGNFGNCHYLKDDPSPWHSWSLFVRLVVFSVQVFNKRSVQIINKPSSCWHKIWRTVQVKIGSLLWSPPRLSVCVSVNRGQGLDQGWPIFLGARPQNICKFRRSPFACPWEFWRAQ